MGMRVSLITVGCRMNRFDTDLMRDGFLRRGYRPVGEFEEAEVYVVNTCCVTAGGDRASRQAIYRSKRVNPRSVVIATGCLAQVDPDQLSRLKEVDLVVGNTHKGEIVRILEEFLERREGKVYVGEIFREKELKNFDLITYFEGVRPFLKIQEGCNRFCSFCVIPFARGKVRSVPPEKVIRQVELLAERGFNEVVLSGTQLSQYGWDLGTNLYELLRRLIKIPIPMIRLSSMHAGEMDQRLIDLITSEEKIAPHFHLSLQSGSDLILKKMERGYTLSEFARIVERIVIRRPPSAVGTDIIAGFPGEGDREFAETLRAVEELPFAYLHVFPYSERKGTKAIKLSGKVPHSVIKERVKTLQELGKRKRKEFISSNVGRVLRGIVLDDERVLTENYIELRRETGLKPGELVKVIPSEEDAHDN
jgi:threonylcarbamoyladenosine tRNA methylthiotransferase MtaB